MAGPKDFDAIRADAPFTTLDGQETFVLQSGGVTKGGFMSVLKSWVLDGLSVVANAISDASDTGKTVLTGTPAQARTAIGAQASLTTVTEAEATAGTSTSVRGWTPALVRSAINAVTDLLQPKTVATVTAAKTVDVGMLHRLNIANGATAFAITLPRTSTTFDTSARLTIINTGTTTITIQTAAGATSVGKGITANSTTLAQYDSVRISCIAADQWLLEK